MYRLNQRKKKTHEGVENMKSQFQELNPMGEIRMLYVHPQRGVRMVCRFEWDVYEILEDEKETIFYLLPDNIFLSCKASDLFRVGKRVYLMGDAVVYRLNREDDYADMSTDDMAETCLELMERTQRVKMGGYCFPVINLTEEDEDEKE